jgi:tripartite-type tricarboxylate transporter receptor subunit TctC
MISIFHARPWARVLAATTLAASTLAALPAAHAQGLATPVITITVPYGAGGIVDNTARAYAEKLGQELGQPVVVENRGGAGGMIGMAAVAKGPAERSLAFSAISPVTLSPHLMKTMYDPLKDLQPVAAVMYSPVFLVAGPKFTGTTFADMLALAKKDPGALSLATAGVGSLGHLMLEQINRQAGVSITHVPYKGMAQLVPDALGGQFTLALVNASGPVNGLIDEGKFKLLAVGAPTRLPARPNTPTLAELGFPAANMSSTFGFFAPGGASPQYVARMNALLNKISGMPEINKPLTQALNVMLIESPAAFAAQIHKEYEDSGRIVKDANIKID